MPKNSTSVDEAEKLNEMARQLLSMAPVTSLAAPQMQQMIDAQDQIMSEFKAYSDAWYRRRHEAALSLMDAVKAMSENGGTDFGQSMTIMNSWMSQSMERMAEDLRDGYSLSLRCTELGTQTALTESTTTKAG